MIVERLNSLQDEGSKCQRMTINKGRLTMKSDVVTNQANLGGGEGTKIGREENSSSLKLDLIVARELNDNV